jgi:hypothetical protein
MIISDSKFRKVWTGQDEGTCVFLCGLFRKAEIPFRVDQHHRLLLKRLDETFSIFVAVERYENARQIVERDAMNIPQEDSASGEPRVRNEPSVTSDSYTGGGDHTPGYPLVARICSPKSELECSRVKMSLRENDIAVREEVNSAGRNLYVAASDERHAKAIVSEIERGSFEE